MKGEIEKIWDNESRNGERYLGLSVDGQRYTLWEEKYFDKLKEGDVIDFEWKKSGKYKNITKINTNDFDDFMERKQESIIRMSCLKSASELIAGSDLEAGKRANMALDVAKKFENYVKDDLDEDPPEPKKKSR
jgi:hypothetical protein